MHHCIRLAQLLSLAFLALGSAAYAQEESPAPAPVPADTSTDTSTAPAPAAGDATATAPSGEAAAPTEETPAVAATAAKGPARSHYGVAGRWRWVTLPGWFLGLFAEKNVPLSTVNCWGLEGFWRKHDKDDPNRTWEIVVSAGYQNMTPPDGYWLGRGKDPAKDADLVQVRGLGLITMDAAYVIRQYFSPYFGIHYGAGLGLGIVRGKVLRTSATYNEVTGQYTVQNSSGTICQPDAKCNKEALAQTELQPPDRGPTDPHRFEEDSVPGALPIINILAGIDVRIPIPDVGAKNGAIEIRLEGGFYDAFFVGLSGGYAY
jgi:hypothetical protein